MKKTLAAIEAEIARLKGMADKIYKDEVAGVIDRMRTAIDHYGLTAADLGFGAGAGARKTKAYAAGAATKTGLIAGVAKYRDPATGKTWTGRGKPPAWIAGAANRDAFLIGAPRAEASGIEMTGSPAAAESASAGKRKAGSAKPKGRAAAKKTGGRRKASAESQAAQ